MSTRHDHLLAALEHLQKTLEARDALGAEKATDQVLEMLAATTEPAADPRLRPVFVRCQILADNLKEDLHEALRSTAASSRAATAYEREVGAGP